MASRLSQYQGSLDLEFMGDVDAALRNKGSKWAYRLSFLTVAAFVLFLVWIIFFATRDEVTRGEGQITPSLGVQPVQSEQGGIIQEVFVKEGQEVKKGDRLVQMANVGVLAEYQNLLNKQVESSLALRRLDAEAEGTSLEYTPEEMAANPETVNDQLRLYTARKDKFESGKREIEATLEQKRRAVEEALSRKQQHEATLLLLKEQVDRVRPLVEKRLYPELNYLNLRQRVVSLETELNTLAETISRTQSEVRGEEARLAGLDSERQASIAAERNDYRRQLNSINERLVAGSHQVKISDLRAPMNGVVRRILLKEESVAQRAQTIMELLPTDDTLEVDARFRPADRGYISEGMPAQIKVAAYDFTIYGSLPAVVTRISPDTIEDAKGQAWYEVRLRTDASKLEYKGEELEMKPGMTVTADVISGKKTVFDYLMKPLLKSQQEGRAVGHTPDMPGTAAPEGQTPPDGSIVPDDSGEPAAQDLPADGAEGTAPPSAVPGSAANDAER